MYDTLLDELEDDVTTHTDDPAELVDKSVDLDVVDDDDELLPEPSPLDLDIDAKTDEILSADEDGESWSDDPVRMYFTQMGEIPLLTRKEEIALAKQIEITRAAFRRKLLCCDYVIRSRGQGFAPRARGELPFDRTVQVSVTDRLEKDQILGRLPHNLRDAGSAVGAQCGRLPRCHEQVAQAERAKGCVEAAEPAPLPGRAAGRRAWSADAADRADDSASSSSSARGSISFAARSSR